MVKNTGMILILGIMLTSQVIDTMGSPALFSVPNESEGNEVTTYNFPFITRAQWKARQPKKTLPLPSPVPYVVIHHSYIPPACYTSVECYQAMKSMQNFHMDDRNWWDIGYHFAVGSDGVAYEGRGWGILGAHALHFNNVSIGICLIGDWRNAVPPATQLKTAQALIAAGVDKGYIKSDYKLVGHRQVRETECPGDALFYEIQSWKNYSPFPASVDDLPQVIQLGR